MSVRRLALCLLAACLPGGAVLAAEPAPAAPAATAPTAPRIILRQILFADSLEGAQALQPDPTKGYIVLSGPLAGSDAAELGRRLAAGEGRPSPTNCSWGSFKSPPASSVSATCRWPR